VIEMEEEDKIQDLGTEEAIKGNLATIGEVKTRKLKVFLKFKPKEIFTKMNPKRKELLRLLKETARKELQMRELLKR
jgi:hypothetical protein